MDRDHRTPFEVAMHKVCQRSAQMGFPQLVEYGGEVLSPLRETLEELVYHYTWLLRDEMREAALEDIVISHIERLVHPEGRAGHDSFMADLKLKMLDAHNFILGYWFDSPNYKSHIINKFQLFVQDQIQLD